MKAQKKKEGNNSWVATRFEVGKLLGLKKGNFCRLEKWAGIKTTPSKTGYTLVEFEKLKKRVSELRRYLTR